MTRETRSGWIASAVLHVLLLLLLVVVAVPNASQESNFLVVQWGSVASATPARGAEEGKRETAPVPAPSTRTSIRTTLQSSQPVSLPKRMLPDPTQEALSVPRVEKLGPPEPLAQPSQRPVLGAGDRVTSDNRVEGKKGAGEEARGDLPVTSPGAGASLAAPAAGGGAPYTIEWKQGGARKLLSGELPTYPPGVSVEAQVKLLTTVQPDGSVSAIQPSQKANRKLEEAAIRQVRLWRFEPLRSDQPQIDQTCVITFLFQLR
jgi:TonB family protein